MRGTSTSGNPFFHSKVAILDAGRNARVQRAVRGLYISPLLASARALDCGPDNEDPPRPPAIARGAHGFAIAPRRPAVAKGGRYDRIGADDGGAARWPLRAGAGGATPRAARRGLDLRQSRAMCASSGPRKLSAGRRQRRRL